MSVHPGSRWIDDNWARLTPGLWAAVSEKGMVAENSDYKSLLSALRRMNVRLEDVTIVQVPAGVVQ